MDLNGFTKVFDLLLPRSRAWNLVFARPLRGLFLAFAAIPKAIYDHVGSLFLDMFPADTDRGLDWSRQFGSPYELSSTQLDAEWAQFGGQTPKYFQDKLHEYGFETCYVHEWWVPGSSPVEARNPILYVETSDVLVNDIGHIEKDYLFQSMETDADPFESADDENFFAYFGGYIGHHQVDKEYPTPDIETEYPNYFYVCGVNWPDFAIVPSSQLRKLKKLIYKLKPMHLRVILRVLTYDDGVGGDDYDIQDTYWHEIMFSDQVTDPSPEEEIQDYY